MSEHINNVTIVGSGPAGLTAAIYAARAGLRPVLYTGIQPGGQLTTTTEIENFPGFPKGIQGPQLMQDMTAQAERFGTIVYPEHIDKVDFSGKIKKLFISGKEILSKTIIISTGATAQTLGLPNEKELMGRGISTCATCDGFFYRNKVVAVVGGGDSAMEEASYLATLCRKVYLIHRRDGFRASQIMLERARNNPKIEFKIPYGVTAPMSDKSGLTGIKLQNLATHATEELVVDGLFYAIGHKPNSEVFLPYVDLDEQGYIRVHDFTKTKTAGVFAAGDIADPKFKQAITAAGMGCQAAIQAQHYLQDWAD
jgi:thioredoxin reductase (NADPH)